MDEGGVVWVGLSRSGRIGGELLQVEREFVHPRIGVVRLGCQGAFKVVKTGLGTEALPRTER